MLQTSLLTDRKFLGYNNICVAEIRDNAASGCGSAWLEHLVWDQGVAGSNPVFPTILKPVDQMIYGFCFLSCSLVVVRKIDGVEAGYAWKDEKHPCCGGAAEPAAS